MHTRLQEPARVGAGRSNVAMIVLDRLTVVTSPMYGTTGAHYSYDVLDNLTSVTAPSTANEGTCAYCYDEHWRLTNVKASSSPGILEWRQMEGFGGARNRF